MGKRLIDLALASGMLLALSPLMLICALIVKLSSPGPLVYKAKRVGLGGRLFTMYKFRSMVKDAHKLGSGVTAVDDPRVTKGGRVLRRFRLDELPQLINVIKGDMSLVGPRPEDPRYVKLYTPRQKRVLSVRPGITGMAQLIYRDEEEMLRGKADPEEFYVKSIMPEKLEIDLDYVQNRSLALDLKILLKTALTFVRSAKRSEVSG